MQTELRTDPCGSTRVIALKTTAGNKAGVTVLLGVGGKEFEFSDFIASQGRAGKIVTLYPKSLSLAPLLRSSIEVLQRGWPLRQRNSRRIGYAR